MALPVGKNLTIYKGDSYEISFRLRGRDENGDPGDYVDLSGCTAKAQVRQSEDAVSVMAEFTAEIPNQALDDMGRVNLSLTPEQTGAAGFQAGKWDCQITWPNGSVKTYLSGSVAVTKEVTRA